MPQGEPDKGRARRGRSKEENALIREKTPSRGRERESEATGRNKELVTSKWEFTAAAKT